MSATSARSSAELRPHVAPVARLLVVLLLVFYGWAAWANVLSVSHDPLAGAHAHQAVADGGADHGHSHDLPAFEEPDASAHQHGHDAADHSHEKQNLTRHAVPLAVAVGRHWLPAQPVAPPPAPCFALERPPRFLTCS